ncbi:MAG: methylmalonyl Co-A mutase-associated GTPase MeaB [Chitinophagales bacterium]
MIHPSSLLQKLEHGDIKSLARAITLVENDLKGSAELLETIHVRDIPFIGITGPPGAGKSSLVNALVHHLLQKNFKIGVVAIDPSSPFNFGSLLGDRIRLAEHFNHPNVYIRSMATRGSLGGLSDKIMEVTDVMRAFPFDYIFIETVGVGQSEVEIAGLADTTIVVMVPEAGDEIQTMKAGLMEIADIFVVNKADRADADRFAKNLRTLSASVMTKEWMIPVLKTVATNDEGIDELLQQIQLHQDALLSNTRKLMLLAEKAWRIIQKEKMKDIDKKKLLAELQNESTKEGFNVYRFAKQFP